MATFQIITDSCCDLPAQVLAEREIKLVSLNLHFRGQTIADSTGDHIKTLYDALRSGEAATTSAVNPETWRGAIEPVLAEGRDALVLAFSSGLSTTYQSAVIAANELAEQYPERTVKVVDTLSASLGQGLMVWYACNKRDAGRSLEEVCAWCEENKQHVCQWFTVDDLMYLKRGGRVSAATALVGTMLNIKPVLHVDPEGHLISKSKVRGRKAAIEAVAAKLAELGEGWDNSTVFISHGDCLGEAEQLADILKAKYGVKEVLINYVGAVIGSHAGPGTIAFFFLGKHR